MNVLLVDDEPSMLKMMKLMLQSSGFQIFDALHANDAMALARDNKVDVLVTDVVLDKDVDGFSLARSILAEYPKIAVVFISGYPSTFESKRHEFGRSTFLHKPFQKADLVQAVVELSKGSNSGT